MPIFTANIPTPLKVGDKIEIGGKIKENARKMSVNLCAQEGEEPRDVVLHFDVRFHRDNIISLSRKNGIWIGSGNYDTNYNMFVPGTVFRIIFDIKDTDVITIYCQGKFHSNFLPKIPLSMAKFIVAWADVERVTHCYFHLASKGVSGDDIASPGVYLPQSPRLSPGDATFKHRHRKLSPSSPSPHGETSAESSDEEVPRLKVDGRADKYFYDSLMCDTPDHPKFASPETTRRRDASLIRNKLDYNNRKFKEMTESDKNYSEDYSEIMSKNVDSSVGDTDEMTALAKKKRSRRGKFAQVVNFMSKSKRN